MGSFGGSEGDRQQLRYLGRLAAEAFERRDHRSNDFLVIFIAEDSNKSGFCGYSLLTIFVNLAYFFERFRNFGTVVERLARESRVPEVVQKLLLSGIDETGLIQTRVPIDSRITRTKASVASIGRASHS